MTEGTLSNILIVESDDKVYFVEDKKKRTKLLKNLEIVNKNKQFNKMPISSPVK